MKINGKQHTLNRWTFRFGKKVELDGWATAIENLIANRSRLLEIWIYTQQNAQIPAKRK